MRNPSTIRRRVALVCLAMALSALTPVGASAQFCLSQGDCEDGLFCTDDTCLLGVCVRTARNCADLNFQCTADSCSESARRCVHTVTVGLECEDFNIFTDEFCDAQGQCVATVCSTCTGDCETNLNCSTGFICFEGHCVEEGFLEDTPTPTRTPMRFRFTPITRARPSGTATRSATRTSTATRMPTGIATHTPTRTATSSSTATHTFTRTPTATPGEVGSPTPTATSTLTVTAEPTAVEQPTDTPTASPTRAATDALDTPTPSPSPTPPVQCPGDCDDDAAVGINELVLGVNIALNGLPTRTCPALDPDGSGAVDIAELVSAVSAALLGCA